MGTPRIESTGAPTHKPAPVSSKREFEKIILEISRLASSARGLAGSYLEALIAQSQTNADKQWNWQLRGSLAQIISAGVGAALIGRGGVPEQFNMATKVGDIFKSLADTNQSTYQLEQQKTQHATQQWQTWANGLQDLIRNLEAGKQRLQQMEDATNR